MSAVVGALRSRVLVTNKIPSAAMERLLSKGIDVDYRKEDSPMPKEELIARAYPCSGVLCTLVIEQLPNLKVISTVSVGYDHIDVQSCKDKKILVGHTAGTLTETTAELTIALLLSVTRRVIEASFAVRNGEWGDWKSEWMLGTDIFGSVIGIIGFGAIGKAVAKRLVPFGCQKILVSQPRRPSEEELDLGNGIMAEYVPFEDLLKESDIISIHCPLNKATKHLFNESAFHKMKSSSVLINTSRGDVVLQDDLLVALQKKEIRAAGLDVTTPEPISPSHPLVSLPNCVIFPHIGSATHATRLKMAQLAVDNLIAGVSNVPLPKQVC